MTRVDAMGPPLEFERDSFVFCNELGEPLKNFLHKTIQRIEAQRRESGEAASWQQDLAELRKNVPQGLQKGHTLIELHVSVRSEKTQPHLESIVWALSSVG